MNEDNTNSKGLAFTALANNYCAALASARESTREEFVAEMLALLPVIYSSISEVSPVSLNVEEEYFSSYVDEDYYESIRHHAEQLLGPDDIFLETFEEDMKYSDTPIAASISEGLADIFQDLFNFTQRVRDSEGEALEGALRECKENFEAYWGQTLCNVLRALHCIRYSRRGDADD